MKICNPGVMISNSTEGWRTKNGLVTLSGGSPVLPPKPIAIPSAIAPDPGGAKEGTVFGELASSVSWLVMPSWSPWSKSPSKTSISC